MASPGSTSHDQPVVDFRAFANQQMGALVIENLKAEMMLADEQIKLHWSKIQTEFALFDQKKNALFSALQTAEGEARANDILTFEIKIMQPKQFWDIHSDVVARKGKIDAQMAAMEPQAYIAMLHNMRANINNDLNAHANLTGHTRSPAPSPTAYSMTVEELLGLRTKSMVDNQESGCPTPATTPTAAKRSFPSGDPGPSTSKRARTTPDTVGHVSPSPISPTRTTRSLVGPTFPAGPTSQTTSTSSTGIFKVTNKPVQSWEVEGNEYIFNYPPFGDGWFVLRCDMGPDARPGVGGPGQGGFISDPFKDNNALRHFNDDKTCVGHDTTRTYTEVECMILYAHKVVGNDVDEVWVSDANSVLEGLAGKAARDKKGKGPEIGPANRPRGGPARSRRMDI